MHKTLHDAEFQSLHSIDVPQAPLICFSHLRWDFVFQRPQHLMVRFARRRDVVVFEEPTFGHPAIALAVRTCAQSGVVIATPNLPHGLEGACLDAVVRELLDELIAERGIERPVLWYYTPMMLTLSRHLEASAEGDPYYPVPRPENQALYKRYEALARARTDVSFIGRLASYRYYNMDQVIGQALAAYRRLDLPPKAAGRSWPETALVRP